MTGTDKYVPSDRLHDCLEMQRILWRQGVVLSALEIYHVWEEYSEGYAAGWLIRPEDEESLVNIFRSILQEA